MPSKAVYTALAVARSDTGCSTILIPWVEESVIVTPEVVGHIDPAVRGRVRTNGEARNRAPAHQSSAVCAGHGRDRRSGSAQLLDADQVARGIAEGAVADPVRLLDRLLDDLGGVAGLHPLEGAVEVLGGQEDPAVGALGHHLGDGAALVVGDAGVGGRRCQEDGRAGLAGWADGDPAHLAGSDVGADLEAEGVAVEGQGGVRVVVREEACVNGDVHDGQASCGPVTGASRFLTGLVTCFATHDGIPAVASAAWRR